MVCQGVRTMDERDAQTSAGQFLLGRIAAGPPLLLDGATGTELERRGLYTGLPLWSSHALLDAPRAVAAVHADYARAGAEIVTANTFRTQRRTLGRADGIGPSLGERDLELTGLAVELAREGAASAGHRVLVAGSAPTLEDCYQPDRVPGPESLRREHTRHAENLAQAGADLILVETMNTVREAAAAARAARATGLPLLVSFVSWRGARLLSGEPLSEAVRAVRPFAPLAVLVNCLPPSAVPACLALLGRGDLAYGVYANLGEPEGERGFERSEDCSPGEFARHAAAWVRAGARLVGGCCGTTPAHIGALSRSLCTGPGPAG